MQRKPIIQYDGVKTTVALSCSGDTFYLSYWQDGYEVLTETFNDGKDAAFDRYMIAKNAVLVCEEGESILLGTR